jgi:hypothetical protein
MNLQKNIRKVLKEETNLKKIIHKLIKNAGINVAIDVAGGFYELCEIMEIETPIDLLNLYNDFTRENQDLLTKLKDLKSSDEEYDNKEKSILKQLSILNTLIVNILKFKKLVK